MAAKTNYPFRTTYRQDENTYVEDRGYAHEVNKDSPDYATLNKEFGDILQVGQTAKQASDGGEWEVIEGFPLLDDRKAAKLELLNSAWLVAEENGVVESEAGFVIDATERANRDITGLITGMEATGLETVTFCAADNTFHEVTLAQLKTMLLEIIQHGQAIYQKKWELRTAITNAATVAELDAVEISFA